MITDQLGLSEVQKENVDSIVGYFRDQMKALHDEFDEAYSSRYRELNRQVRDAVRAVMTEDQLVAYDSLRTEWDRRRQERRQDSISGDRGSRD